MYNYCFPNAGSSKAVVDFFKSQRGVLNDLLQHDLSSIASKLFSKSVISAAALAEAKNQNHIASVRTVSLLSVVEDKIRADPNAFTEFVKILKTEPSLEPLAKQLSEDYLKGIEKCTIYIILLYPDDNHV